MNKKELVNSMKEKTGFNLKDSELALNAIIEAISESLVNGEDVKLIGFGTFGTKPAAARIATNMHTGEKINIPAKIKPFCKISSVIKKAVADS